MEGKKRYVAIVLFLLIGLTLFTFANPVEEQKGSKGNGSNKPEVTDKDTTDGTLGSAENQNQTQTQVLNQVADNSYEDALAAVERAESTFEDLDVEEARDLIEQVTNQNQKEELTERLDIVEEAIEAIKLVEELEKMVEDAEKRDDILSTVDYRTDKEIIEKVEALRNEEVQESLEDRLEILSRILDDNTAPTYEGVTDGETTREDVSITYSDTDEETETENEVTVKVTLNGEEIEFQDKFTEEGEYVVTLTDEAFNETIITFTIDKTAAKYHAVNANVNGYKNNVKTQYAKNGNTITAYISMNEELDHNPTFKFYINGKKVQEVAKEDVIASIGSNAEYPYVYTAKLKIDENVEAEDGLITFKVVDIVDKAGNKSDDITKMTPTGKTLNLDRTAAKAKYVAILSKGDNYLYAKNGDTIRFLVAFNEEVQIPSNYKDGSFILEINGQKVHFMRSQGAGYEYIAEYKIPENEANLAEGELTFAISGYTDVNGNVGEVLTEATHGTYNKVIYDRTKNMVTFTTLSTDNSYVDGNVYYVKNGNTITFRMGVREKFATAPVVTIGGMKVELEYVKYFAQPNHHEYKGTVTIPTDEKDLAEGTLPIAISNITDLAGNQGFIYNYPKSAPVESVNKKETTNHKSVVYDKTENFVVSTSFSTSRKLVDNNVYYVTYGDTVTLTIGTKEKFSAKPNVLIGGKEVTLSNPKYFVAEDRYQYTATLKVDETTELVDGKVPFEISNVTDMVGNEGFRYQYPKSKPVTNVKKNVTTNGRSVYVDVVGPEVTPNYSEKTVEEDSADEFTDYPTFTVTDNSGLTVSQELISGEVNIHKVGTYRLVYRFTDQLGNYTDVKVKVNVVDTTAPVISGITNGAYYNTHDTHAIPTATDKNGAVMYIRTELGDLKLTSFLKNEKEIKLVGTYKIWAVDKYGNKSEEITIHVDPYAPKVLVLDRFENVSGAYLPIKPVILEHNLDKIAVKLDGKEIPYEKGQQLTKDGNYEMTVTDKAGNKTTVNFTMDSVAPTMMISPLTIGVVDELDTNKVNSITGDIISTEDVEFQLMKATKNITVLGKQIPIYEYVKMPEDGIVDEEGQYILIAYDKAYNVTAAKFTVDRTAPVVTGVEDGKYYNTDVTINIEEANLNEVMILGTTLYKNNLPVEFKNGDTITADGNYKLVAKDTAGNEAEPVTFVIDKTAPVIEVPVKEEVLQGTEPVSVVAKVTDKNVDSKNLVPNVTKIVDGVETDLGLQETIDVTTNGVAYKLFYTVTDKAGNPTSIELTTTVVNITYEVRFNKSTYEGTYNGTAHSIPEDAKFIMIKDGVESEVTDAVINYSTETEMVNAGTYTITAELNGYSTTATYKINKAEIGLTFPVGPLTKDTTLEQIVEGVTVTGVDKSALEFKLYRTNYGWNQPLIKEVTKVDKVGGLYYYGLAVTLKEEYKDNYILLDLPVIEGLGINGKFYESK